MSGDYSLKYNVTVQNDFNSISWLLAGTLDVLQVFRQVIYE